MKKVLSALLATVLCAIVLSVPATAKTRVSCIGDSITCGIGTENPGTDSYPAQLQRLLGENYDVSNFGCSGATLLRHGHYPYIEREEFRMAMAWAADIIIIDLGVNDTDPRDWPNFRDEFVGDYLTLIDTLKTSSPRAKFYVAIPTPIGSGHPRFSSSARQWQEEIRSGILKVAELSGAEVIDFYTPLYPYHSHFPDFLHPDGFGAFLMARTAYADITGDFGGVQMSPIYSDNMVLQQGVDLDIHGIANAGEKLKVTLGKKTVKTQAGKDGKWVAQFKPLKASDKPIKLIVRSDSRTISFENIIVGEVWLCSGQSNMEWALRGSSTIEPVADDALRFYNMTGRWAPENNEWTEDALKAVDQLNYFNIPSWEKCSAQSATDFSAVAYCFGMMLREKLGVPVGLICNAVGGSPIESWIDRHSLETEFPAILGDWTNNDYLQEWVRTRALKNLGGSGYTRHPYEPAYLYESGILSLDEYPVKGVIWYQGESNAHNFGAYEKLFPMLVDSWRAYFGNPALPFGYVQLSSLNRPSWPWFRDAQRRLLGCREGLGMVVTSDLGDPVDIHYADKKPVGDRLALWALHDVYGQKKVVCSGPTFKGMKAGGKKLTVTFDNASGLAASGENLIGFEIAGKDGIFYPAKAQIKGASVILTSKEVSKPVMVRYAWEPYTRANLVNGAGLPASTFREELPAR